MTDNEIKHICRLSNQAHLFLLKTGETQNDAGDHWMLENFVWWYDKPDYITLRGGQYHSVKVAYDAI